jgi:hypothetical protein
MSESKDHSQLSGLVELLDLRLASRVRRKGAANVKSAPLEIDIEPHDGFEIVDGIVLHDRHRNLER